MREEDFPRPSKDKEMYHHNSFFTRNAKGSSSSLNKRLISNMKTCESIKVIGKGEYIVKFKTLLYYHCGVYNTLNSSL